MTTSSRTLAKRVIAEIIRAASGKWSGKTRLYKAFYFAHLFYANREPDYLTDWPIVRMPNGPGIDHGEALLNELVATGVLDRQPCPVGPYNSVEYRLQSTALPGDALTPEAIDAIKDAVDFVQNLSAVDLSEMTHEYSRSWNSSTDGQELNIYVDLIPEDEYTQRRSSLETIRQEMEAARRQRQADPDG